MNCMNDLSAVKALKKYFISEGERENTWELW